MTKEIELDKKTMAILAVGLCSIVLLTFLSGVVTGIALWTPTQKELALLKDRGSAPNVPVVATAAAPPAARPEPKPVEPKPVEPKPVEPKPVGPAPAPATPAPAAQPAQAEAAAPPPAAPEDDVFSLQVGSFLDAKNARQLQTDLKEKGYNTIVFTALDNEQREWHVVRIGGFRTMTSASRAAADFSGKERRAAMIRRSDRL
jgi:cell division protein FtsN